MGRVMSAHQPNFIPYLGFFDKMQQSDIFIIRDEVQFVERDWHHRNSIRMQGTDEKGMPQSKWLTLPVHKEIKEIRDILIKNHVKLKNTPWNKYLLRQIKAGYEGADFFKGYFPQLQDIFLSDNNKLLELNMKIINFLRRAFDIRTEVAYASDLIKEHEKISASGDLARLCKLVGADTYLSGAGGKSYLNLKLFEKAGVKVIFQDFKHPVYKQRYPGFLPNMAAIDALFNTGNFPSIAEQNPAEQKEQNSPQKLEVINS